MLFSRQLKTRFSGLTLLDWMNKCFCTHPSLPMTWMQPSRRSKIWPCDPGEYLSKMTLLSQTSFAFRTAQPVIKNSPRCTFCLPSHDQKSRMKTRWSSGWMAGLAAPQCLALGPSRDLTFTATMRLAQRWTKSLRWNTTSTPGTTKQMSCFWTSHLALVFLWRKILFRCAEMKMISRGTLNDSLTDFI